MTEQENLVREFFRAVVEKNFGMTFLRFFHQNLPKKMSCVGMDLLQLIVVDEPHVKKTSFADAASKQYHLTTSQDWRQTVLLKSDLGVC